MRFRHSFAYLVLAVLTALALVGCSSGTQASTAAVATAGNAAADGATFVQVQSIDGSKITAIVGTLSQGAGGAQQPGALPDQAGDGDQSGAEQKGSAPELPSGGNSGSQGNGDSQPQGTPPEQQADGSSDSQPQGTPGQQPAGDGQQGGGQQGGGQQGGGQQGGGQAGGAGFTAGDESITFTINDSTKITAQSGPDSATTDATTLTAADIAVGDILAITLSSDNVAQTIVVQQSGLPQSADATAQSGEPGATFGGSETVTNGTSANTIDTDSTVSGETYNSSGDDENALRVDGASVTLSDISVNKTGGESSNTENGDFYGQNAGLLALNGATVTITGATVNTNAVNGNGVFSYGEGTTVNISDSVIRTSQRNSGGIQTTGGATMNATNLDIQTEGASAAAIRSDRGGGTVTVNGGTYVTNGTGSPAIYSTANISASDAVLTANASEAIVIEGKNSVTLTNVTLSGNMQASTDENENVHNIMLYQSMSGDAEVGQSSFSATGGSILANAGDMFYVTNTTCDISLENVALTLANDILLTVSGNTSSRGWGTEGANGGICTFTATNQTLSGNIIVDSISSLDFSLASGSTFTGAINTSGAAGTVNVSMASGTTWVLTGDSYITSFTGDVSQITTNGYTVYVNGTAI